MSTRKPPQYVWVVHPLLDSPRKSVFLVLFLVFLVIGIQFLFDSLGVTFLSTFFLFGSLRQYFFPFRYEVYDDQITVSSFFLNKIDYGMNSEVIILINMGFCSVRSQNRLDWRVFAEFMFVSAWINLWCRILFRVRSEWKIAQHWEQSSYLP